jgi:hypothetical protein
VETNIRLVSSNYSFHVAFASKNAQPVSQLLQLLCFCHQFGPLSVGFLTHSRPICLLAGENRPTFHQAARQEVAIDPHRSVTGPNRSKRGESMSWPLRGRWHLGPSCLFLLEALYRLTADTRSVFSLTTLHYCCQTPTADDNIPRHETSLGPVSQCRFGFLSFT